MSAHSKSPFRDFVVDAIPVSRLLKQAPVSRKPPSHGPMRPQRSIDHERMDQSSVTHGIGPIHTHVIEFDGLSGGFANDVCWDPYHDERDETAFQAFRRWFRGQ